MELELWAELSQAICDVHSRIPGQARDKHPTARIVRVYLWAALHDRPVSWACCRQNWTARTAPPELPDQSTMSRRTRRADFEAFQMRLAMRLSGKPARSLLKKIDGMPLELPNHTRDPDARWGRGVSRKSIGYKLHAIHSANPLPDAFTITPLNVCEKQMAHRLIRRVGGGGYLLGDAHYNASWLFDVCAHHGYQLLCPRAKPGTGMGHRYQSPERLRAMNMLEPPGAINDFGPELYRCRIDIERRFSQLSCFGGGLTCLPPWIRRIWRVRHWVWAKLLIDAARFRIKRKKAVGA